MEMSFEKKLTIAIDGPAGAGKSSAAKGLSRQLAYLYLDTGALYRAMAWKILDEKIDPNDITKVNLRCQSLEIHLDLDELKNAVWVNGQVVTAFIRSPDVTAAASLISSYPVVRRKLLSVQQAFGREGGVVAEGRDIGTVVFPQADLKFYLDADVSVRGARRQKDLLRQGLKADQSKTTDDIKTRDRNDRSRPLSPLKKAEDAIFIDSTLLKPQEVIDLMLNEFSRMQASRS